MAAARASRRESGRREVRNRDGLGGGAGGGGDSEAAAQEEGVNSVHVQWWEGVVGYRLARTRSCGLAAVRGPQEKYLAGLQPCVGGGRNILRPCGMSAQWSFLPSLAIQ